MQGPNYPGLTRSISWLLKPWQHKEPHHQQQWYWQCKLGRSLFHVTKVRKIKLSWHKYSVRKIKSFIRPQIPKWSLLKWNIKTERMKTDGKCINRTQVFWGKSAPCWQILGMLKAKYGGYPLISFSRFNLDTYKIYSQVIYSHGS